MNVDEAPGLLSAPRLANPPHSAFLAGILFPMVLVAYVAVIVTRLPVVLLLVIVRFLMAGLYASSQVPILGLLLVVPALLLFFLLGIVRTLFQGLLDLNLLISGMDEGSRMKYISFVIGPVVGPGKGKPVCTLYGSAGLITNGDVYSGVYQTLSDAGLPDEADEFDARWEQLSESFTDEEFARQTKKLAERYVRIRIV